MFNSILKKVILPTIAATSFTYSEQAQALNCDVDERPVEVHINAAEHADDLARIPIYDEQSSEEYFLTLGGTGALTQFILSPLVPMNGVYAYNNIFVEYPSGAVTGDAETISTGPDGRWHGTICLHEDIPDFLTYSVYTEGTTVKGVNTGVGYEENGHADVTTTRSTENKFKGWNEGQEQSGAARTQRFLSGETGIYPVIIPREDVERFTGAIAPLYVQKDLEGMIPATNDSHVDVVGTTIHKENKNIGEEYRLCFAEEIQGFFLKTGGDRIQADNCATIPETYVGECTFYVDDLEKNCSIRDDRILNDGRTLDDVITANNGTITINYDRNPYNLRTDITANGETQTFTGDVNYNGPDVPTTIETYVLDGQGERLYTLEEVVGGSDPEVAAAQYVLDWIPDNDSVVHLSNNEIRAMINGNQGTRSYAVDLATELWNDPAVQAAFADIGEVVVWFENRADGIAGNSEFCPDFDPFLWDNNAQGEPAVAVYDGVSCGPIIFHPGEQSMQNIYNIISGVNTETGQLLDGFLRFYVLNNPDLYGGEVGGSANPSHDPTWFTQDPNSN